MKQLRFFLITALLAASLPAAAQQATYTYSVPDKPWHEGMGNHRAVIEVKKAAEAVELHLDWRRGDDAANQKRFLVIHAQTGDTIPNVQKLQVNNESCDIVFGPVHKAGTYYFYYLPYRIQRQQGSYWHGYLNDVPADSLWASSVAKRTDYPRAEVKRIESRTAFDSFYPMEVIATGREVDAYVRSYKQTWFAFPEDRKNPIRMRRYLPLQWMKTVPGDTFTGTAAPNEYYAFQLGVWSPSITLDNVRYEASAFTNGTTVLGKERITCFNTEGINPAGKPFAKRVNVAKGQVQPLWFGLDIPENAPAGMYKGVITLKADHQVDLHIPVAITVAGEPIAERGDNEPWRHSRLRWLNSTLGLADTPILPYTEMKGKDGVVSCMGRDITLNPASALPKQINSWGTNLLHSPITFVVETEQGIRRYEAKTVVTEQSPAHHTWTWKAGDADLTLTCTGRMEFDGWMKYTYTLTPKSDLPVKDIRLELPVRREVASYFLGAGLPGQSTPSAYEGKWDTPEKTVNDHGVSIPVNTQANWLWPFDSFWMGNAHAGIHCELRGTTYSGPLLNAYRPAYPASWHNGGKGGFRLKKEGETTRMTVYSGARTLKANNSIDFEFAFLITPVKPLALKSQFTDRYYHNGAKPVPTDADVKAGVKIINIHHANEYNPYINYPFLSGDKLLPFIREWHKKGCKVKLYYTLRELTNVVTEIWAIRSLGEEILRGGRGGGYPWLREHLVTGYTPQWYQPFEDDSMVAAADAAILTTESDSRWYNYYIEGLRWMVRHYDIDGIYLDDVSFGRDILKRMRRAMEEVKPGCIIDLHSNTGFSRGPANQYAEFFPYIDKVWFGESFLYDKMTPANWLVESSGIPFGLMGDMLHRGGNKWLGMQYGMTVRHPWLTEGVVCDPRVVWKEWDKFGIDKARMIGFWETDAPVSTGDDSVKVTVYQRGKKLLLSVGNYSDVVKRIRLHIDWKKLGLRPHKPRFVIPAIDTFQPALELAEGEELSIEPRKGWLIYVE